MGRGFDKWHDEPIYLAQWLYGCFWVWDRRYEKLDRNRGGRYDEVSLRKVELNYLIKTN